MKRITGTRGALVLAALLAPGLAGCMKEAAVSYSQDVKPILKQNCLECHEKGGSGFEASGFGMASYDDLMKGTKFGPMIIAGDAEGSNLVVLMEGRADPSISMPHGSLDPVSRNDIETIRRWIDQGAKKN
ncbi:MAG: hypothetical protein KJO33_06335 [Gammaproteobacteria bacterium]|nr:hypothetical protein [Gammaproteobacteria bacterium]NNK33747.1 hypothetical protein [Xanthomonadales bacterium]